ncbi:MAG TPA: AmmeMemoRadiSam system radical SAM enzyme [Anaerolineales bacterium]|nr:AmmeMemoRadiSam system radical SAM enzyme [Anaerolineales bacterium]HNQ94051.1 AmmeMemoRadiSam system radical SAM enzyme [Anaerolineales bacterium]HNS59807.1 AmmeMemoRadiSam system radical SAM enzyme [Anaerolineales bacterium]
MATSIGELLDTLTVEGELYEKLPNKEVRCFACGHRCVIREGKRGICQVRFNRDGELRAPHGYVAALQSDPVEKKPFFHVLPSVNALTFGMLGCDYHCGYCQNWLTSQAMRDPSSDVSVNYIRKISPEGMVDYARKTNASIVVSSYNEPLITSEWAVEIFKQAKAAGLMCAYVSNGNNTPEVMEYIRPYISAYKVDLKCMQDKNYRKLGGVLQNTLDGIKRAHDAGLWVEIVTLTIPGFNDSNEELWDAARFIAGVSKDIPWHVTAFHKDYKMTDPDNTDAKTLIRAAEIGREAGLRFVYAGNLPGQVGEYEDTFCPGCNFKLVKRRGYIIQEYHITGEGKCHQCDAKVPGLWHKNPSQVALNGLGVPLPVY